MTTQHVSVNRITKLIFGSLMLAVSVACSDGQASPQSHRDTMAAAPAIALAGRVTDAAQLLTVDQEAALSAKLEKLEQATKHQMVVATVPSLEGQDVAEFTVRLTNSWGIGRKGYNDGVVLLVAPKERKARIAVGHGLEKKLPDGLCQEIMDRRILPRFREGDLAGGIDAGVDALVAKLVG